MPHSSLSRLSLRFLFVTLLLLTPGFAQDYRGRVEGIVTDQTKSVIAGSTVTLRNVNTGIKIVHKTSDTGLYLFDLVEPGSYSITVEQPGFGTFVQENIVVQTRGDVTVNAMLSAGRFSKTLRLSRRLLPPCSSIPATGTSPSIPRWRRKYRASTAIPSS